MSNFRELAIIGPTASGKSALAIDTALKHNGVIFSIDSLAVYREMDIVSAKPSLQERSSVPHFGIDVLSIDQHFSAQKVALLYDEAKGYALKQNKNLIIVGGTSFYLKSLLTGLSVLPDFSEATQRRAEELLADLPSAYELLSSADPQSTATIDPNDRYRIEKLLLLYLETQTPPSRYFEQHPPQNIIEELPVFEIIVSRETLRERVARRTSMMLDSGLIDEIARLEAKYGRRYSPMKAIGVIEALQYLDNEIDLVQLHQLITTHTMQLAKRQSTFNRTQFSDVVQAPLASLPALIAQVF